MYLDSTFTTIIKTHLDQTQAPCLMGEAGIGKSAWTKALSETMHTKVFSVACNLLADKADLTGGRLVKTDSSYEQRFYPHAQVNAAIRYANDNPDESPILFLDEFNRSNEDITSAVLSLITERNIGGVPLPDNLKIIAAGNDRGNTGCLDSASISRFVMYHIEPCVSTFLQVNPNLHPIIKESLIQHPEYLVCYPKESSEDLEGDVDEILQFTTPRTITALSGMLNRFSATDLRQLCSQRNRKNENRLMEIVYGTIGRTNLAVDVIRRLNDYLDKTVCTSASAPLPGKPDFYDELKAMPTAKMQQEAIRRMSAADKTETLCYALYECADNTSLISMLSTEVKPSRSKALSNLKILIANGSLNEMNVAFLMESCPSPITADLQNSYTPTAFLPDVN